MSHPPERNSEMNPAENPSHWEVRYREQAVETMPWYYPDLDPDFAEALSKMRITSGRVVDLGTGPGTQAVALAQKGFEVTATDISDTAVAQARRTSESLGLTVDFRQDDVTRSTLEGEHDLVFDRGCFHVLAPEARRAYVETVSGLLKPGGWLLLKCFSHNEPGSQGPHRFSPQQIRSYFGKLFRIHSITESIFQGTHEPRPKALLCVMEKPPTGR